MAANTKKTASSSSSTGPLPTVLKQDGSSGFDKLLHERSRLAIISALAANKSLSFNELKSALQISDGNLSVHARKLEEAEYLTCDKQFKGRVPRTQFSLTDKGRKALSAYIEHMEAVINAVKNI